MSILLIGSAVDDGSTSISREYRDALQPDHYLEISEPLKSLSVVGVIRLGLKLRKLSEQADHVVSILHSPVMLAGWFVSKRRLKSFTCMTDWTPAFPSGKNDIKTRFKMVVYRWVLKRYHRILIPVENIRKYFTHRLQLRNEAILLPPPYGKPPFAALHEDGLPVKILFMGGDLKRKGGEVLLGMWEKDPPRDAELTMVTSRIPGTTPPRVHHISDLKARTERHHQVLESHQIFVLPSYREAYGFAALEALNHGQVVAVTRNAGISSLIAKAGGIVEDTPERVIQACFDLASDPRKIRDKQLEARAFAEGYRTDFKKQLQLMVTSRY